MEKLFDSADFAVGAKEMGVMHVSYESSLKESDGRAVFSSPPCDLCPVEHGGYVLNGSCLVTLRKGEEVYNEADVHASRPAMYLS